MLEGREGRRNKARNEKRELARGQSHKGHLKSVAFTLSEKESHWWVFNREKQALTDVLTGSLKCNLRPGIWKVIQKRRDDTK